MISYPSIQSEQIAAAKKPSPLLYMVIFGILILIATILVACGANATPTVIVPTASWTAIVTDTLRPTDTPTMMPTATPVATETPTLEPTMTATPIIHRATVTDPKLLTEVYPHGVTVDPRTLPKDYQMVIDVPKWDYQMDDVSLLLGYEAYMDKDHPVIEAKDMVDRWPWMADPREYNWYVLNYFHGQDVNTDPDRHMFQAWYFTNRWDMRPWIMNIPNADGNRQHPFLEFTLDDGAVINPTTGQRGPHGLKDFASVGTYPDQSQFIFGDTAAKMKYGLWSFYAVIPMDRKVMKVQVSKWPGGPKYTVYEGDGTTPLAPAKQ
jgi:hypothetical protein